MLIGTKWSSRTLFIIAAVGAAAGIGNLWRFPYLAFENGGGAFFVAFIIALIVFAIPLAIGEVAIGQNSGSTLPDVFGGIKKGFSYLGWFIAAVGAIIVTYYVVVIGWAVRYIPLSLTKPWGSSIEDSSNHFYSSVLNLTDSVSVMGSFSVPLIISTLLVWTFIYFAIFKGIKSIQSVVLWTASIPFVTLIVLAFHSLTLPGSIVGITQLFVPDFSALLSTDIWIAAFSQAFFSVSVALGIFVVYATHNRQEQRVTSTILWIVLGDLLISIFSGIVVFSTLGFMSSVQGIPFNEVIQGGPGLVFAVMPVAFSLLPALSTVIALLFFISVFLLGVDSAFALLEVVISPLRKVFRSLSNASLALICIVPLALLSLLFTTGAGIYYLDIIDHFVIQYAVIAVAFVESIIFGWFYRKEIIDFVNSRSGINIGFLWTFAVSIFIPVVLAYLLIANIYSEINAPYEGYPIGALLLLGVGSVVLALVLAAIGNTLGSKSE